MLEPMLHHHANALLDMIEKRVIQQYFSPYQSLPLATMSADLGIAMDALEPKLAGLIASHELSARLDACQNILLATAVSERQDMVEQILRDTERAMRLMELAQYRVSLHHAGLVVRSDERLQ